MNKTELAKRINVTRQTITNWEKSKPELIRLIELGLSSDNQYSKFLDLFPKKNIMIMHDFYIDFYFRFLNHYRKNITNHEVTLHYNQQDVSSTALIYFLENSKDDLFSPSLEVTDVDISKFVSPHFKKPLFIDDKDLSEYILKNVLDDFQTLLTDVRLKNEDEDETLFYKAIYIAIYYLIYKFESSLKFKQIQKRFRDIIENILGINLKENTVTDSLDEVYNKYIQFRLVYTQKHIHEIEDELPGYKNNHFYVPDFITDLENEE